MAPNDVVTRAIDAVCAGDHLTADHAAAVLAEIMEGRAGEVQTGAFLIALRAKGETVPELVGLARTMRSLAAPVRRPRARPRRHRRHRRRPVDLQRLDHGGAGRRRRPAARSPSTATAPTPASAAPPTCSRRSGSTSSSSPSRSAAASTRSASASCSRPATTRRWRTSSRSARSSAVRTIFNFLGPLTNPAGARAPAARRLRPPLPGDDRRGAGRPRQRAGDGRHRRGRPRRALDLRAHAGDRGRRRRRPRSGSSSPAEFGLADGGAGGGRRRHAGGERRRDSRAVLDGEQGPAPRPRPAQRRRGDLRRRRGRRASPQGVEKAAEAIDSGAAARVCSTRLVAATRATVGD